MKHVIAQKIRMIEQHLPMAFALVLDILEWSLFAFAALTTTEAILPGIISSRIPFAKPLLAILLLLAFATFLGRLLKASFPFSPDKRSLLAWIGISWLAFLLTLSAIKFPFWSIPIIVGSFFLVAAFFWKIFFRGEA